MYVVKTDLIWDEQNLHILAKLLPSLPTHFYQPDSNGAKLEVVLSVRDHAGSKNRIELNHSMLNPDNEVEALKALTHELVHRVEHITSKESTSGWFERIEQILGDNYMEILAQGKYAQTLYGDNTITEKLIWTLNRSEFLASLSESYVQGKDHFFKLYKKFFREDAVSTLYDFVRDEIFRGREY